MRFIETPTRSLINMEHISYLLQHNTAIHIYVINDKSPYMLKYKSVEECDDWYDYLKNVLINSSDGVIVKLHDGA